MAHQPSGVDANHPAISQGDSILIELSTLKTLCGVNVEEAIVETFVVHITKDDKDSISADLHRLGIQRRIQEWHMDLWKCLSEDGRFVKSSCSIPQDVQETNKDIAHDATAASLFLAQKTALPLLVDDRMCQAIILNSNPKATYGAFGTDNVLESMMAAQLISIEETAQAYLSLFKWRYRFILPPAEILKVWLDKYASHPPGHDLKAVALYVHDCMRDLGLFSGLEPTEPPTTVATKLFDAWVTIIAKFTMNVWEDANYTDDEARAVTSWACSEFFPSPPKSHRQNTHLFLELFPRILLSQVMLEAVTAENSDRAGNCLMAIKDGLNLDDARYQQFIVEIIDALAD